DQRHQPRDVGHRQAITERARDRKADPGCLGADTDIAARGDPGSAAGAGAGNGGDGRYPDLLQRAQHAVDPRFVVERILRGLEGAELRDVGAGRKCLVAGAGQDHRLDRAVGVGVLANLGHLLVHRKRQRVARLRPIEGDAGDAVRNGIDQIFTRTYRGVHGALFLLWSHPALLLEHDLRANALVCREGKTGTHFSGSCYATAAFDFGTGTASRALRTSIAARTPPLRCGTWARANPISIPDSVPISIRSLKCPM